MSYLRSLCKHYRKQEELLSHLNPVLDTFTGLHPEQNDFVYDDGRVELLLSITGTIEVIYRGNPYHCPLAIYLPLNYPTKPPMVRIVPSNTMQIRVGKHVDPNGQVSIAYLEDWERKGEGRSLLPLMSDLRLQFGLEYPLQLITSNQQQQQQPTRPPPLPSSSHLSNYSDRSSTPASSSTFPPRPPPPPQAYTQSSNRLSLDGINDPRPNYSSSSSQPYSSPPPRPPIPFNQSHSPPPSIQSTNLPPPRPPIPPFRSNTLDQNSSRPPSSHQLDSQPLYRPSPDLNLYHQPSSNLLPPSPFPPSISPYTHSSPPSSTRSTTLPNYNSIPTTLPLPQRPMYSSPPPPPAPVLPLSPQHSYNNNSNQIPIQSSSLLSPPSLRDAQQQRHFQPSPSPLPSHSGQSNSNSNSTIGGLHPASALIPRRINKPIVVAAVNILDDTDDMITSNTQSSSSASNAPPPRPPNPELLSIRLKLHSKLTYHLNQLNLHTSNKLTEQELITQDLLKGVPAIKDEMSRLLAVKSVCEGVRNKFFTIVQEGENRLKLYQERGDGPEVDEIVCSSTVVYNQLLELVAEDSALEDTIYHLGRGLNSDTANIDLEQFLKRVRGLAREQFGKRALINKILLGLSTIPTTTRR